jgi:hypothetical protein
MLGAVAKITYDWSVTEDGMASGIDA